MAQPPVKPIWAGDKAGLDPKRSHRYILYLEGVPTYFVSMAGVPEFTVTEGGTHKFLGHEFRFPGSVQWSKSIQIKLVDTIEYNMSKKFMDSVRQAGYVYPSNFSESSANPEYYRKTVSKAKFPFKQVKLQKIDSDGITYETWVLNNPWISKVNFGEANSEKEGLVNLTIDFIYDWAELRDGDSGNPPPFPK